METVASITQLLGPVLSGNPYIFLFIGFFIFGETVFLPALYLALFGPLNVTHITGLMVFAALLSDVIWYLVGRYIPYDRLRRMIGQRLTHTMDSIEDVFRENRLKILFVSKFVYGTRTVVQILSGVFRTRFVPYFLVDIAGTVTLIGGIVAVALVTHSTVETFMTSVDRAKMTFVVFVLAVIALHIIIKRYIAPRWFQ